MVDIHAPGAQLMVDIHAPGRPLDPQYLRLGGLGGQLLQISTLQGAI